MKDIGQRLRDACAQCASNARHNIRGGYQAAAILCLEYCEAGHRFIALEHVGGERSPAQHVRSAA